MPDGLRMSLRPLPRPATGPSTRPVTVIVRALPAAARSGRIAGLVEVVDTGDVVPVADTAELVALILRLARDADH